MSAGAGTDVGPATRADAQAVSIPFKERDFGELVEVAPGIIWARLPLPYQPGHVNTYLVEDDDGWCAIDCGLLDEATQATWDKVIEALPGRRLSRVIATHWHSDHVGAAGWLCRRTGAPLQMPEAEYLKSLAMEYVPRSVAGQIEREFFTSHGLNAADTEEWVASGHHYLYMAAPLPRTFDRLVAGQELEIGRRRFRIRAGLGHSPEELMLRADDGDVYLCADQLGPKIAPNIAVQPSQPLGNPLDLYFQCLQDILADAPPDALLLTGHEQPFRGLAQRVDALRAYYLRRCEKVEAACREGARTATELLPHLVRRPPGPVWVGFLISEVVTYAHYLVARGRMRRHRDTGGIIRFEAT